jgi:hypothetical protein
MLLDDDVPRLTSATPPAQITIQRSARILHVTALRVHARSSAICRLLFSS